MATIARAPLAVLPNVTMSQSSVMGAALIGGFLLYLMLKGKLGAYWSLLMGGSAQAPPVTTGTQSGPAAPGAYVDPKTGGSIILNPNPSYLIPPGYGLPGLLNPFYQPPAAPAAPNSSTPATGGK
jgi:hypothetical protein